MVVPLISVLPLILKKPTFLVILDPDSDWTFRPFEQPPEAKLDLLKVPGFETTPELILKDRGWLDLLDPSDEA